MTTVRPLRLELRVQCLPPGQAGAAASIAGPRDEQHLAAVQRLLSRNGLPVAVDQLGSAAAAVLSARARWRWPGRAPTGRARRRGRAASRAALAATSTSSVPSSRSEPGAGTHTSPRHRPCGFGSQPVRSANSAGVDAVERVEDHRDTVPRRQRRAALREVVRARREVARGRRGPRRPTAPSARTARRRRRPARRAPAASARRCASRCPRATRVRRR